MYVVSSKHEGKISGQIANTVFQITAEPPTVAVSINKQNYTHELISGSRVFTVSILREETSMNFIGQFGFKSGRDTDKFAGVSHKTGVTGAPIVLDNAIGYLEAEVIDSLDVGTHTVFIGRLVDAQGLSAEDPMTYAYYHLVKRGKSPKAAPTYIKPVEKEELFMEKYTCTLCGYVYDPKDGDPDNGVKPGTPWEQVPEDWVCPVCGADKSAFEKSA